MKRSLALLVMLGVSALAVPAGAAIPVKDAKLGVYVRYSDANVRIDKIERVAHVDGAPLASEADVGDGTTGYLIFTLSVQNPTSAEIFMPAFNIVEFLDDQSKIDSDTAGPFVLSSKREAPGRLAPKESVKVRIVQFGIPADRTLTKFIFDPNNGTPQLRFQPTAADIATLPEVPRPQ